MLKFKLRRAYLRPLTIPKLLPSLLTLLGLVVGLTSLKLALEGKWELSISCIVAAAMIDGLDGRVARMLNATSKFGAELDSLCDFVNFGVVPGLITYLWSLRDFKLRPLAWSVVLLFVICIVIRLARFNTDIFSDPAAKLSKHFFRGIPSPVAAILALMPVIIDFNLAEHLAIHMTDYKISCMIYLVIIGLLSASRFPTFSIKHLKINPEYIWVCLWGFAFLIITMLIYPWYLLPVLCLLYIITIPISVYFAKRIN